MPATTYSAEGTPTATPIEPAMADARRRCERDAGRDIEDHELKSERPECLGNEREEAEAERYDVTEENRPRHGAKLGVALLGQRPDMDRECDEQKSEQTRGGCDEGDV